MLKKLLNIVSSIRFWMISLAAVSAFLGYVQANGFDWKTLFDSIALWLAAVTGIGTLDSVATKFGESVKE